MKTWNERLQHAIKLSDMNKGQFAKAVKVSSPTVTDWTKGEIKELKAENASKIANVLGIRIDWLLFGKGEMLSSPKAEPNAAYSDHDGFIEWDSNTQFGPDTIAVPFFKDIELSAGNGLDGAIETNGKKLMFARSTLKAQGVEIDNARCVSVSGNSMEPVLPDGSTVGIDTGNTSITDGKMYAINNEGSLFVKLLYKLPGGGIRIRSYNADEYPEERYLGDDAGKITVIGKVFWSSVLY